MPILKKEDVTPRRPVILMIYGQAGSGKTSVATTANNPVIIDTDKGYDRSVQRVDTLIATKWEDVIAEQKAGTFDNYGTIVLDTVKGCTDDYLQVYVLAQDYKLQKNALKRFGAMSDHFKSFVNFLRSKGCDIIFIAHDKETQDGDLIKHSPDCTGQSKDLLIRIADEVGYLFVENGERKISFNPDETHVGKNVADLPVVTIPKAGSAEFSDFMANLIEKVKDGIQNKSEANRMANKLVSELREQLQSAQTEEDIENLIKGMQSLPKGLQVPFFNDMKANLSQKGYTYHSKEKKFTKNEQSE